MEPGFNVPLGANTAPLKRDMAEAAQITKRSSDLMAQSIGVVDAKQKLLNQTLATQLNNLGDLTRRYGENSKEALRMATAAEKTRQQLASIIPADAGGKARSAAGGFDALGNSVNQLTREMPAFANSAQTGFMAISNNLPIFFDAISQIKAKNAELAASGQPVKSVMSQLAGSILSVGTGLSLGVTALTLFGPKIVTFISDIFSASSEVAEFNRQLQKNVESLKIAAAAFDNYKAIYGEGLSKFEKQRFDARMTYEKRLQELTKETQKVIQNEEETGKKNLVARNLIYFSVQRNAQNYRKELENINKEEEKSKRKKVEPFKWGVDLVPLKSSMPDMQKVMGEFSNSIARYIKPVPLENFIDTSKLGEQLSFVQTLFRDEFMNMRDVAVKAMGDIGLAATNALGESLVTGDFDFSSITNVLAQLANTIAKGLAAIGTVLIGIPATQSQGIMYLAGAAALGVAAGVIRASGSSSSSNGQSNNREYGWQNSTPTRYMAEGGLLYGRTAFVGGEYAGASSNPEVVAPLNKLKSIIGGSGGTLETMLTGRKIKFALLREDRYRRQNFGR